MEARAQSESKNAVVEVKSTVKKLNKNIELTSEGLLIITSHLKETPFLCSLEPQPLDEKEIKSLMADIIKDTEGYMTGWTRGGQTTYLKNAVLKLVASKKIKSEEVAAVIQDEKLQAPLLDLLYNAKHIFQTKVLKQRETYIEAFKQAFEVFSAIIGLEHANYIFNMCLLEENSLRLVPLATSLIKMHEDHLEAFHLSELVGHRIAYAIAKNPGQVKKVIIKNTTEQVFHTFLVEEIGVIKMDGQRDLGLMGAFLLPEVMDTLDPTLRMVWAGTHSVESAKLNNEITPGEESYRRAENQILSQVLTKLNRLQAINKIPIRLVISGHSLGGALSQLTIHSLMRVILLNFNQELGTQSEIEFQKELAKETAGIEHQNNITEFKLASASVKELALEVWNSPGVLKSVESHSNKIAPILIGNAVVLKADYGMVHGDVVQTTGQGMLLSDIKNNKVVMRVLKVQPNSLDLKTKSLAGVGALSVGRTIGAAAIGGPVGAVATAVTVGGMAYASLSKITMEAHQLHSFMDTSTPQHPYILLTSHDDAGHLNLGENGITAILAELHFKSVIADAVPRAMGYFAVPQAREETLKEKGEQRFNASLMQLREEKSSDHEILALFATEMKNEPRYACERIWKAVAELKMSINSVDRAGKTLLHWAVEANCVELIKKLLSRKEEIGVNLTDKMGNTPFLTCLLSKSINYEIASLLLEHPYTDVHITNYQGHSAKSLHDSWRSYGAPGSQTREFCLKLRDRLILKDDSCAMNKYVNLL